MLSSSLALKPSPSPIDLHLCQYGFKISLALANSSSAIQSTTGGTQGDVKSTTIVCMYQFQLMQSRE